MNPAVSIVVPLYNYSNYIDDCIQSCIEQTFDDFEVVIVDDCSTDDSHEKAKQWAKKDSRIRLFAQSKNMMLAATKNRGIIESTGELIVHLDADDMLSKKSVEVRLKALKDSPEAMFVHGRAYVFRGEKNYGWCLKNKSTLTVDRKTDVHAQTVMIRRDSYRKYGLYDENLLTNSDKEMWIRLIHTAGVEAVSIEEPVAFYRLHGKSMMVRRKNNKAYDKKVTKLIRDAIAKRKDEGITPDNTRLLT